MADPRLLEALQLIAEKARSGLERHPSGHLLAGRRETLHLELPLPLANRNGELAGAAETLEATLQASLEAALVQHATFLPGRAYCLKDQSSECEHAYQPGPRAIFTGYGATGLPRWADLGQWLLERGDPEVELLFAAKPGFVCRVLGEEELCHELLDAYRDEEGGYRLHGQVVAGWYPAPGPHGLKTPLALTLQVVSSRPQGGPRGVPRRFALTLLARGPEGETLEELYDRMAQVPWLGPVRWAQDILASIEADGARARSSKARRHRDARLEGLLGGLARRLTRDRRGKDRRTRHGEQRHGEDDRPTGMALADLRRAGRDDLLFDVRRETLVVLGEKGRAHVFSPDGKLVTSVRYSPAAIDRRRTKGLWRRAKPAQLGGLEKRLGIELGGDASEP